MVSRSLLLLLWAGLLPCTTVIKFADAQPRLPARFFACSWGIVVLRPKISAVEAR
jgi:hypothetical protein